MRTRAQTRTRTTRVKKRTTRVEKRTTQVATRPRRTAAVRPSTRPIGNRVLKPAPWEGEIGLVYKHIGYPPRKGLEPNGSHKLFSLQMKVLAGIKQRPKYYRPDCVIPLKGGRILIDKNWKKARRPLWTYFNAKHNSKAAWHTFSEWTNKGCKMQIFANLTPFISMNEPAEYPPVFLNYEIGVVAL